MEYSDLNGCSRCGIVLPEGQYIPWGEEKLCPDCMDMICPSFDEHQNKTETEAAYREMKERYTGRRVKDVRGQVKRIDIDIYGRLFVHYYMDIAVDPDGYITDLSRLEAIALPGPHASYDEGRLYPVTDMDYLTTVDVIFEDDIRFEDD